MGVITYSNTTRIRLIGDGDQLGIQINNSLTYYTRTDLTVSSDGTALITILNNGEDLFSAFSQAFIDPTGSSINEIVTKIQALFNVVFVGALTVDEIEGIQESPNPLSSSNPIATQLDLVGLSSYTEDIIVIAATNSGAWVTRTILADANKVIDVLISGTGGGGDKTVGVRAFGSVLSRNTLMKDKGTFVMRVKLDDLGRFEIFGTSNNIDFIKIGEE